jgi:ABC-type glycerol-3-phosphate transport system substrate-binding protein
MTKDEKSGFMTLNFDWMYWGLFEESGVKLLNSDGTKAAFNTPKAEALLKRLADLTAKGAISTVSWTKRWAELNDAFAAGIIGMFNSNSTTYHNVKANGDWINQDTMGIAPFPGGWKVPGQHGLSMSAFTEYPDEAFELLKIITNDKWGQSFAKQTNILTGNIEVDRWYMNQPQIKEDPLNYDLIKTIMTNSEKITGHFPLAQEARIKETFFSTIQGALLGQTSAKVALDKAEIEVNKILNE